MKRLTPPVGLVLLTLLSTGCDELLAPDDDVVQVAPPTGNPAADRERIMDALDEVRTGGTIRFAQGV